VSAVRSAPAARDRTPPAAAPMHPTPTHRSAGQIVGRPDLSDAAVLGAIAERLGFEGRDPCQAKVVLDAALAGKASAVDFVRSLVLPMPDAPLAMPEQPLLARKVSRP
jgi:hypothetical protein